MKWMYEKDDKYGELLARIGALERAHEALVRHFETHVSADVHDIELIHEYLKVEKVTTPAETKLVRTRQ